MQSMHSKCHAPVMFCMRIGVLGLQPPAGCCAGRAALTAVQLHSDGAVAAAAAAAAGGSDANPVLNLTRQLAALHTSILCLAAAGGRPPRQHLGHEGCAVLCCAVLCCAVLCCVVPCHVVLCCARCAAPPVLGCCAAAAVRGQLRSMPAHPAMATLAAECGSGGCASPASETDFVASCDRPSPHRAAWHAHYLRHPPE